MRISLVVLLVALAVVIGFGLGVNRASAWYLLATCFGFVTALQISYVAGAVAVATR